SLSREIFSPIQRVCLNIAIEVYFSFVVGWWLGSILVRLGNMTLFGSSLRDLRSFSNKILFVVPASLGSTKQRTTTSSQAFSLAMKTMEGLSFTSISLMGVSSNKLR